MPKTKSKEFLIKLMELKASRIKDIWYNYFTKEDKEDIEKWGIDRANDVADEIFMNILGTVDDEYYFEVSDTHLCPFCVYYMENGASKCNSGECSYSKRHGICHKKDSEYSKFFEETGVEISSFVLKGDLIELIEFYTGEKYEE